MATYGVDYYGRAYYGASVLTDYAVGNLTATQLGFGRVRVSWSAPTQNVWTNLTLVRSRYGYPVSPTDGQQLGVWSVTQASTSFDDVDLTPGYWYYGMFAATPLPAWQAALTYQVGDRVSYSASNWICVQLALPGTAPGSGSAYWSETFETQIWQPAGAVGTLSVAEHAYSALMYSLVPGAYKAAPVLSTDASEINDDLAAFLGVLAFGYEIAATELDDMYRLYTPETTRWDRLLQISAMLGISPEAASSPRYQRLRTRDAASLARSKGTLAGLAAMIAATTGLECEITTGANLMLSRDQSDFPFPVYPDWKSDESYAVGDLVTYQGVRYVCSSYSLNGVALPTTAFTGTPNAVSTISGIGANIAEVCTTPGSLSWSLDAPVAGVYELTFAFEQRPTGGVVTFLLDGESEEVLPPDTVQTLQIRPVGWGTVVESLPNVDTYASTAGTNTSDYTFLAFLTQGTHTIAMSSATKNSSSTGYDIVVTNIAVVGVFDWYPPSTTAPDSAVTNGTQWQVASTGTTPVTEYANAITGGVSTWNGIPGLGVYYYGPNLGLEIASSNWITANTASLTGGTTYVLSSAEHPSITAYSNTTAYTAGSIVTYQGLQYTALTSTAGTAPPAPGVWVRSAYASPYDRELIDQSTTPIHSAPVYDPNAVYGEGASVQYGNALFVTPNGAAGIGPPASAGSNSGWEYAGPAAAQALTASLYVPQPITGYDLVYPGIAFFDQSGQPVAAASMMSSAGTATTMLPVFARLIEPVLDLDSRLLDTQRAAWTVSPTGYWQISSGACAPSPAYTGSQRIRLAHTDAGMSDGNIGITALTEMPSPSVTDIGLLLRYTDVTDFFACFRDSLYLYSAGVKTLLASWSRFAVGTRWYVNLSGSTIRVYAYPGNCAVPSLITTVTNSTNQTSTIHGLISWTF